MTHLMTFINNVNRFRAPGYRTLVQSNLASVNTALGPIPADMGSFINTIANLGVGIGGVLAVGLLAYGGFTILTSSGDPEKLMQGREIITNALMGLALVILAVVVLQWLGWDILGIGNLTGVSRDLGNISNP